jgi:hypothetical protein
METNNMKKTRQKIGTSALSNNHRAASPLALRNTARTGTFLTRTQLRGVTNCAHQKEKERHPKVGILFFSLKALKAKARVKEKARANRAKARAIAKEKKARKEKHPKVLEGAWMTRVTSASSWATTKHNAPSLLLCPRAPDMAGFAPSSLTRKSMSMTFLRTLSTRTFVPTVSQPIAIGTLAPLQWSLFCSRKPRNLL